MFYYLSFLRPPPIQAHLGSSISITPQIANDLRTELYSEVQDVYYAWCHSTSCAMVPSSPMQITKPMKLTTWRTGNAYREVSIPPPQGVRNGQMYRLVLTTHAQGFPHIVNLGGQAIGERPFPVISMPVLFSSRSKPTKTGKQEQVERIYRISTSPNEQAFLSIKEKTSFDLDKKIWDSGVGLSAWLVELASMTEDPLGLPWIRHLRGLLMHDRCEVIELGSGTGAVSLTLESAMPLLQQNISANEKLFRSKSARPQAVVLDWDEPNLPIGLSEYPYGFDLIVMADVTYNTSSFPSLVRTLDKLLRLGDDRGDRSTPTVLLGYKERDASERALWEMVNGVGIKLEKIGEKAGADEPPVEIWAARLARS
ncbi:hypothetical protein NM688_g8195 [Phlebia brevispora]|uniref:Uncharacterized protein n=1 Tax=Phlebia brevispora TaxID=194682 RepID=A0ACC1RWH8_9APHY|nr:hypothetical protein NM688_g8195 [Phlebia brevispora]